MASARPSPLGRAKRVITHRSLQRPAITHEPWRRGHSMQTTFCRAVGRQPRAVRAVHTYVHTLPCPAPLPRRRVALWRTHPRSRQRARAGTCRPCSSLPSSCSSELQRTAAWLRPLSDPVHYRTGTHRRKERSVPRRTTRRRIGVPDAFRRLPMSEEDLAGLPSFRVIRVSTEAQDYRGGPEGQAH